MPQNTQKYVVHVPGDSGMVYAKKLSHLGLGEPEGLFLRVDALDE